MDITRYENLKIEFESLVDGEQELAHNVALEDTCHRDGIQNTYVVRVEEIKLLLWNWFIEKLKEIKKEGD